MFREIGSVLWEDVTEDVVEDVVDGSSLDIGFVNGYFIVLLNC